MYLYHYYDSSRAPFLNLSDLPREKAEDILEEIKRVNPASQAAGRHPEYVADRLYYESIMREKFAELGGIIKRNAPHYMVVGESDQQHLKPTLQNEKKVYNRNYEDRKIKGTFKKLGRPETNELRKLPPQA